MKIKEYKNYSVKVFKAVLLRYKFILIDSNNTLAYIIERNDDDIFTDIRYCRYQFDKFLKENKLNIEDEINVIMSNSGFVFKKVGWYYWYAVR